MHEDVIVAKIEPDTVVVQPAFFHDAGFPLLRPSRRIEMSHRVLGAGVQIAARVILEGPCDLFVFCHVSAENKPNLAIRLLLLHVHDASAEGLEDKAFDRAFTFRIPIRVLPGADANPGNLWVSL